LVNAGVIGMENLFNDIDMIPFCDNDDVYCKCRMCIESQINGGNCTHCFACIQGEKAIDNCEEYKK